MWDCKSAFDMKNSFWLLNELPRANFWQEIEKLSWVLKKFGKMASFDFWPLLPLLCVLPDQIPLQTWPRGQYYIWPDILCTLNLLLQSAGKINIFFWSNMTLHRPKDYVSWPLTHIHDNPCHSEIHIYWLVERMKILPTWTGTLPKRGLILCMSSY